MAGTAERNTLTLTGYDWTSPVVFFLKNAESTIEFSNREK
jgi:hypothetical protein